MLKKRLIIVAALAAILALLGPVQVAAVDTDNVFVGRWLSSNFGDLTPLEDGLGNLQGREGYYLGKYDNKIVMIYGYASGIGDSNHVRIYDIDMDTWSAGTPSPFGVRAEGVGVSKGEFVYAIGSRNVPQNQFDAYNVLLDSWVNLADMQVGRRGAAAALVGNKIYAIGGNAAGQPPPSFNDAPLDVAEVYDIATDTWSSITPPDTQITDAVAVAHGGKVFVIGGYDGSGPSDLVQIYNPVTDTWAYGADMPTPRYSLAAAALGDTIYAIGGKNGANRLSDVEAYDIDKDMWVEEIATKPNPSSEASAVAHGNKIYVPGSGIFGTPQSFFDAFVRK